MAQTLKFGKGTWATKTGSSMAYNDQNGNYKPLPFNVERDSIATRVNKEGLIEVVGKDKLRIDYTDSAKGVALLENSATNYVLKSDDILSTYQSQNGNVSDANNPINSFNNSIQIEYDASNNSLVYKRDFNPTIGTTYTISCFVQMNDNSEPLQTVNANSGDFSLINNNTTVNASDIKTERIGSTNVYKVSATKTATDTNNRFGIIKYSTQSLKGFKVSGFQLEQNSFATSYIPTSGSTVQRQADVVNGSGNSEVFNDSEGVLFADIASNSDTTTAYNSIGIGSDSSNNRISIGFDASSNLYVFKRTSSQWLSNTSNDIKLYNKIAISYNTNDNHFWLNGFKIDSNTTIGDLSTKPYELGFEATFGGNNFYGKTKEVGYYDATLTDSELEYLTSYRSLNELVTELNLNTL
jgi:hypothetical protein